MKRMLIVVVVALMLFGCATLKTKTEPEPRVSWVKGITFTQKEVKLQMGMRYDGIMVWRVKPEEEKED
jgi:uncharacterized protein YceK